MNNNEKNSNKVNVYYYFNDLHYQIINCLLCCSFPVSQVKSYNALL